MPLSQDLKRVAGKKWHVAESTGSVGIIGIICFIVAAVLLWKPFLGGFSKWVALALCVLVPLLGL